MSLISWKGYVKSNILEFRRHYNELPSELKELVEKNKQMFYRSLNEPCQALVIVFHEPYLVCYAFFHNLECPDLEIIVLEDVKFEDLFTVISQEPRLVNLIDKDIKPFVEEVKLFAQTQAMNEKILFSNLWELKSVNGFLTVFRRDLRLGKTINSLSGVIYDHFESLLRWRFVREQRRKIEKIVDDLKANARTIPETGVRTKVLGTTKELEEQIKELNQKVEEEIGRLRQVIGSSEKYLDFKAFTSDIEHLKSTHITKETFDANIQRFDEKIDAVSTRIQDLKEMKLWSKRTVLEIGLAVWGAIVTLYAASIIKF